MTERKDQEKENDFISGEDLLKRLPRKEKREFGFLLLGLGFGFGIEILFQGVSFTFENELRWAKAVMLEQESS